MENLVPPPNGSPEEIQAWNSMMDTMVTFIKASTHLMNTITRKVRFNAIAGNAGNMLGGCEPECEACQPKPPCGICGIEEPASSRRAPSSTKTPSKPTSKSKIETPATPGSAADISGVVAGEGEAENDAPAETPETPSSPEDKEDSAEASPETKPSGDAKKKCVCAAIRAKRKEEQKGNCECKEEPPEAPIEQICGCGPTAGNQAGMMEDMVQKLANAQQEINQLQQEMARLQRMDTSRRVGPNAGPNPAALYREIMRDSELNNSYDRMQVRPPVHNIRRRLFQSDNSGGSSARSERPARSGPQQMFETSSAMDSPPNGLYDGTPGPERVNCPRLTARGGQRLFQSDSSPESTPHDIFNSTADPTSHNIFGSLADSTPPQNNIFASTAVDMSMMGSEGGAHSFFGCIPCDEDRTPMSGMEQSVIGISPISRLSTPQQRPMLQGSMLQGSMMQRSMPVGPTQQSMAERSVMNRSAPAQYMAGVQAPCRRPPASGSFRGRSSTYQDSPSTPDANDWRKHNYTNLATISDTPDGKDWRKNEYSNLARIPEASSRRIVMCGPPPAQSESCPPACKNRTQNNTLNNTM